MDAYTTALNGGQIAAGILGMPGRMISASKSMYSTAYPGNVVVFNSNICTKEGKIWYGDIDVTLDEAKLNELADAIGERIYVLREMDARFENEGIPLLDKAVWSS